MDYDAVSVAPEVYRVIFENERVRVLDVTAEPGEKSPMHGHQPPRRRNLDWQ